MANATDEFKLDFEKPLAMLQQQIVQLTAGQKNSPRDLSEEIASLEKSLQSALQKTYAHLSAWETVKVARHERRPQFRDYLELFNRPDFCELHGDRAFGDDHAMVAGFARIGGHKVMLMGQHKGHNLPERMKCNFGCAHPEGYRKALLKMKLAAKFHVPIVTLIDTPGAYPGIGAEERGQSQAIAINLLEMSLLPVPILSIVIGEGGSGGALGIGVCDRLAMMEFAYYSVISPEGCASILFKKPDQAPHAAESLKLTAKDLQKLGVADDIIKEPLGGAHREPKEAAGALEKYVSEALRELKRIPKEVLLQKRYERYRKQGQAFVVGL